MTALQIANKSLAILGYTDNNNNTDLTQRVLNRILPLVNLVFSDICRMCDMKEKEIKSYVNKNHTQFIMDIFMMEMK